MNPITTWDELIASGMQTSRDKLELGRTYLVLSNDEDGRLRRDYGLVPWSHPHSGPYGFTGAPEDVVIVTEGPLVFDETGVLFWLDHRQIGTPHARTTDNLGLAGNHDDPTVNSVIIDSEAAKHVSFTDTPAPLRPWERAMLGTTLLSS